MSSEILFMENGQIISRCDTAADTAFRRNVGCGLLSLLSREIPPDAGPGYHFLCRLVRSFSLSLIHDPDSAVLEGTVAGQLFSSVSPDIPGYLYLTPEVISGFFSAFQEEVKRAAGVAMMSIPDYIRQLHPDWKDLGKVMFHLAGNPKDTDGTKPFVFLATYQHKISETGQVRNTPLSSALVQYANDRKALLSFLTPVKNAAQKSPFLTKLLEDNRIFKPCFFSSVDAWTFLKDTEVFRGEGIPVRLAGLWRDKPKKLKMELTLDVGKKRGFLAADSLIKFSVGVSLGGITLTPEELQSILDTKGGLIRVKGEWVEAETERVKALLAKWRDAAAVAGTYGLPMSQALRILSRADLPDNGNVPQLEEDICEVNASPQLSEALAELNNPENMALPPLSPFLEKILRSYQRTGVKFLWNMLNAGFGVCLADDMGLGKTLQMISAMTLLRGKGSFSELPALVIAPASLLTNWLDEFHKFAPEMKVLILHHSVLNFQQRQKLADDPVSFLTPYDAVIITYSMAARAEYLKKMYFPLIVLDEAQQIKNASSQVSRAVRSLRAAGRVAMTGTPVENSLSDLWSIFDFICPGLLGTPTAFREFVRRMESVKPYPDYTSLRKLVRPYILHRLKTDKKVISDLPDKIERVEKTPLTLFQAKFYVRTVNAMKQELASAGEDRRNGVILSYLLQFKQICNHPSQFSGNGDFSPDRSGKFQRLIRLAAYIASHGEKMLIFTQFREMTEILHEILAEQFHRSGLILHGGVPVEKRREFVQLFQQPDGPPFFVISLKAGGTGLTLTAATHVVHFDRWWNPAVENQATDRAYRIGQKRTVFVHKFVSPGTIEEKIDKLMTGKRYLANSLLEQGTAQLLTEMSNDEIMDFVKLDMESVLEEQEFENEKQ